MQAKFPCWQAVTIKKRRKIFLHGVLDEWYVFVYRLFVMKWLRHAPLFLAPIFLTQCGSFTGPIEGDFDPLSAPGSGIKKETTMVNNYSFQPMQYVTAASNSTAFFSQRPTGNAEAEELLSAGTSMRVVKTEGSFIKVELDNGKVGYVAAAMLTDGSASPATTGNAVQVYPPIGGDGSLPMPAGGMPADLLPASSPLPPTDISTGAPLPPITAPSLPDMPPTTPTPSLELPPSSVDQAAEEKKDEAAAETPKVELPKPAVETPEPPVEAPKIPE
jgi:hypothetical protein